MKSIARGIWRWSWFSQEKQLEFNGHLLEIGEHRVVVDPPPLSSSDRAVLMQRNVDYIVLTNRDHEREADTLAKELRCQLYVPQKDSAAMSVRANKTYADGELLPGGIWVIQLEDQKSPGESALFIQQGQGILIVGDALIGKPEGSVSLLPAEKYADKEKAKQGLRRLLKYNFDMLLVGDGSPILAGAKTAVEHALA